MGDAQVDAVAEQVEVLKALTPEQKAAARAKVQEWFAAWERQAWGSLASHCQVPQAIGKMEADICVILERRLGPYHLTQFAVGEVVAGNSGPSKHEPIAFADVTVIAVVLGRKVGILPRVVFDGKKWGVNFTSINRRFDPETGRPKGESNGNS